MIKAPTPSRTSLSTATHSRQPVLSRMETGNCGQAFLFTMPRVASSNFRKNRRPLVNFSTGLAAKQRSFDVFMVIGEPDGLG